MLSTWAQNFGDRFGSLSAQTARPENSFPVSIKIRVASGCFHRQHSPRAYELIDDALARYDITADGAVMEEHETGPEVLVWLAVVAGSLNLATSIVNLIAVIVKARSDGIRKGDDRADPLEIVVRGEGLKGAYREKQILRVATGARLDEERFHQQLDQAILELFGGIDDKTT